MESISSLLAKMKRLLAMLDEVERENLRLRDTMGRIHVSYVDMANFNVSLRDQIVRNLYVDPPPGIIYGEQTVDVGTQTFQPTDSD